MDKADRNKRFRSFDQYYRVLCLRVSFAFATHTQFFCLLTNELNIVYIDDTYGECEIGARTRPRLCVRAATINSAILFHLCSTLRDNNIFNCGPPIEKESAMLNCIPSA